jgi:hypothetical protein
MQVDASAGIEGGSATEMIFEADGGSISNLDPVFYCTEKNQYWTAVAGKMLPVKGGKTRNYFIQAEEVLWDYAPEGFNRITGKNFTEAEDVFVTNFVGSVYLKCLYFGCV